MSLTMIAAREINTYIKRPECILMDLRDSVDYQEYHIPGAISVHGQQLRYVVERYGPGYRYLLLCDHGSQSLIAARALSNLGYCTISVYGGMEAFRYHQKMIKTIDE